MPRQAAVRLVAVPGVPLFQDWGSTSRRSVSQFRAACKRGAGLATSRFLERPQTIRGSTARCCFRPAGVVRPAVARRLLRHDCDHALAVDPSPLVERSSHDVDADAAVERCCSRTQAVTTATPALIPARARRQVWPRRWDESRKSPDAQPAEVLAATALRRKHHEKPTMSIAAIRLPVLAQPATTKA